MQSTNTPAKVLTPLAEQDSSRAELPNTTSDPTRASQTQGFPPLTGQPPEAGGVPPQLPDMNGALNMASRLGWWGQLGGRWAFDGSFANNSAINGYPRGAMLMSADFTGEWLSTSEANTANPDTTGTGWVPGYHYGATTLASQAGGTVVLTPAQAAKTTLFINGTLTSNLIVEVPAWIREWTVYNGTSGAFTVSIRTPGRPAVVVPQGSVPSLVRGNGTDVAVATLDVPLASTTVAGRTRYATAAETIAGSIQDAANTPFGLAQLTATTARNGLMRFATDAEYNTGAETSRAVTPAQVSGKANRDNPVFTGTVRVESGLFVGAAQGVLAAQNTGGAVNLRPNGAGTTSGEFSVLTDGSASASGAITAGNGTFAGAGTQMLLRPTGRTNTPGEVTITASGVFLAGVVSANGGFDTPSSREIKNDLGPFPYGLEDVMALAPVRYAYKDDPDQRARLGFYLEDVREVAPEVAGASAIQEHQIIPMLVAAVQELTARVRELEAR